MTTLTDQTEAAAAAVAEARTAAAESQTAPDPDSRAEVPWGSPPPSGADGSGQVVSPTAADDGTGADPGPPSLLDNDEAEELGRRLQDRAASIAEATCAFLLMLSEFDEREALRWYPGLKTVAAWVSWACSMSPGAAREHVRVARALRTMPLTVAEFATGRLSFSKVREMTRVADRVDEETLVELARAMTAAQLAVTVGGVRSAMGARIGQECLRETSWSVREDGMIEVRAVLPPETGAELVTAIEHAMAADGTAPPTDDGGIPAPLDADPADPPPLPHRRADALVDVARGYLSAAPKHRSGQDHHLVVVQVTADALAAHAEEQATTPTEDPTEESARDVPPLPAHLPTGDERARVTGLGPLEAATAGRLACTEKVALEVIGSGGEVLHLGRARRLASRAQNRALRLRDGTCRFPGCHQRAHLDAHHVIPWTAGGPTDLENLVLLCRRHHVLVHEGNLHLAWADPTPDVPAGTSPTDPSDRITSARNVPAGTRQLLVLDSAGAPIQAHWPDMLENVQVRPDTSPAAVRRSTDSATRIFPVSGGYGFNLAACVTAMMEHSGTVLSPHVDEVPLRTP